MMEQKDEEDDLALGESDIIIRQKQSVQEKQSMRSVVQEWRIVK